MRWLALPLLLAACAGHAEPPEGFAGVEWRLAELDGQRVDWRATLDLSLPGVARGASPCGDWSAELRAPLPDFGVIAYYAADVACDAPLADAAFATALRAMTRAERQAGMLVLTGPDGQQMIFIQPLK